MNDKAEDPRVTRARLSGPEQVTKDATVAELKRDGSMTVLVKGTNEWVCVPGDENNIGDPPMCMNPMGMRWMMDAMQGKPKPTNAAPGMIYMLCGATQRSNTDPSDRAPRGLASPGLVSGACPFAARRSRDSFVVRFASCCIKELSGRFRPAAIENAKFLTFQPVVVRKESLDFIEKTRIEVLQGLHIRVHMGVRRDADEAIVAHPGLALLLLLGLNRTN